jgi:hypothetical protein
MTKIKYINIIFWGLVLISCEKSGETSGNLSTGKGGSLSKFTIIGNYVYAVSSHFLYTIDISNPSRPSKVNESPLNYDMETLYPYKNRLFIGSKTGLYIYSIEQPAAPKLIGEAKHGRSCDPVVANDSVSYSTLKGSTFCGPATSGLYVYDVKNLNAPVLKKLIPLTEPIGLGMADSALYVCNANDGLKVYDIRDAYFPFEKLTVTGSGFIDVIPYDNLLICWMATGINLYDITNQFKPVFIKNIAN